MISTLLGGQVKEFPVTGRRRGSSISFLPDLYKTLEEISKQKKVSLARIVRDVAEKCVADQWPLLRGK